MALRERRARSSTCAWCLAAFGGRGGAFTRRLQQLQPSRATYTLQSRRPRPQVTHTLKPPLRACADASNDEDGEAGDAGDNTEHAFGNGDFTDPSLFLDMDALRKRIRDVENAPTEQPRLIAGEIDGVEVEITGDSREDDSEAMRFVEQFESIENLWVIVFTSREEREGVYSLALGDESIVLAFQERREAQRYAKMLEGQDFPTAKVCRLESSELREFCVREGFRLGFVPAGSLVAPPEESAIEDKANWHIRSDSANDSEPGNGDNDGSSGLSPEEVELMKRRLENLFGN